MRKEIGKICGAHGIIGELKVFPLVDSIQEFENFDFVYLKGIQFQIESFRPHKNFLLVKFVQINSRTEAEFLSGFLEAEIEVCLEDNEIYISDLIGVQVLDQNSSIIGSVIDFYDSAQALIKIKLTNDQYFGCEVLLPFVEEYILEISPDKKSIKILMSQDLLELNQ